MASTDERLAFIAEWYDPNAALIRRYQFLFYIEDGTVEMYDIKNRRLFLKRSKYEGVSVQDLYIGAIVNVHARQLTITDYADQVTRNKLETQTGRTFAMIKPDALERMGEIVSCIENEGLRICNMNQVHLSKNQASTLYAEHSGKEFYDNLIGFATSGPVIAMELMGHNCVKKWREMLGPTNTQKAKDEAPDSIRAQFGTDGTKNACHGSDSEDSARKEIGFFFGPHAPESTSTLDNCTLCIIKPHAVKDGMAGQIMSSITEQGFQIKAIQMFNVSETNAEEFYEIYKGVVNEYSAMVSELCSGPCIAIEITHHENAPKAFREFTGPSDPDIARHLRGHTLRAKYGIDKIHNAVHCTDLPDDGQLEVEYFFQILNS